jgi:hypothetical protein
MWAIHPAHFHFVVGIATGMQCGPFILGTLLDISTGIHYGHFCSPFAAANSNAAII